MCLFVIVDGSLLWGVVMKSTSDKLFITDIASYRMLSAIDGKSKLMYLVYGDKVFRRSRPPEYMSRTALMRVVHQDSFKNDRELPVDLNRKCTLESYVNKIKAIVAKVVCDQEEGTEDNGRLKKMVEEVAKLTKKKKTNVKYTDHKPSAMTSKQSMDNATISSDEESGKELCTSGEENFSILTSYDGQKQYRPPDKMRTDSKFQIQCNAMLGRGSNEVVEGPIQ